MSTASKWLAGLLILPVLACIWLSLSVLDARRQWDEKVKQKAKQAEDAAREVELLQGGTAEADKEFRALAEKVLATGSKAANDEFKKKVDQEGLNPRAGFEAAMHYFIDQKLIDDFQAAVNALNELEKSPAVDPNRQEAANKVYAAAEKDFSQALNNLDAAYLMLLGESLGEAGLRGIFPKGLGIDVLRSTVNRVQREVVSQKAFYESVISHNQKNETRLKDQREATQFAAAQLIAAANGAESELAERKKQQEQFEAAVAKAKQDLKAAQDKLAQTTAGYEALQERYNKLLAAAQSLAAMIKEREIRIDVVRGLKPAILSADGTVPKGKILQVDEDGAVRINIGTRVGVKPGAQLHVFRFKPEAKYLGILQIDTSDSDTATGRMLPEWRQLSLQVDDNVSTEITY